MAEEPVGVRLDVKGRRSFGREMQAATAQVQGFGRAGETAGSRMRSAMVRARAAVGRFGARARRVGRTLSKTLTVAIAGVAAATSVMAARFQSEMSKIEGLVGVGRKQVGQWKDEILAMAGRVAKGPKELAEAMFFITSAGLRGKEALAALRASAKASAAGLGETKEVANAVTNALNAYEKGSITAKGATDVLTATVREGKAEASELAPQFGRVLPFASELGVSFDQLGGTLAFFTRATGDASKAGTFLEGILRMLVKPTTQGKEALEGIGTSFETVQQRIGEEGLLQVLTDLRGRFDANGVAMSDLFADSNALAGVLQLTGDQANVAKETMDSLAGASGSTQKAFDVASKTASFKFNQALSQLKAVVTSLGRESLPMVTDLLEDLTGWLKSAADWWGNLSGRTKRIIAITAGLAAVLGPALFLLGLLATAIATVSLAAIGWAAAFAGAVVAIGALVAGLIWAWNNSETFRTVVTSVFDAVKATIRTAIDVARVVIDQFVTWAQQIWARWGDQIVRIGRRAWNIVSTVVTEAIKRVKEIIAAVTVAIEVIWAKWGDTIVQFLKATWSNVKLILSGAMNIIFGIVEAGLALIQGDWSGVWDAIKQILKGVVQALVGIVGQAMNTVRATISAGVESVASVWDGIREAMAKPVNWVITNVLNPFLDAIDSVASAVGVDLNLPTIGRMSFGASSGGPGGRTAQPGGFNTGGPVPGQGPDRDSVPAVLTPGEWVINRKVADREGLAAMKALNDGRATIAGQEAALAAADRAQGGPRGRGGDGASMIDVLWNHFSKVPGTTLTSAFRPSSDTYHGRGMAIDVVGDWQALYRAAQGVWGQLAEAIGPGPAWRLDGQTFPIDQARQRWPGLYGSHVSSNRHWHFAATPGTWSGGGGGGGLIDWIRGQFADVAGRLVDPIRERLSDWAGNSGMTALLAGTVDTLIDRALDAVRGQAEQDPLAGMAAGGQLAPGQTAVVGEQGPELAVGGRHGASVIDADTTAALGRRVQIGELNITVEGRGPDEDDEAFARRLARVATDPDVIDDLDRGVTQRQAAR